MQRTNSGCAQDWQWQLMGENLTHEGLDPLDRNVQSEWSNNGKTWRPWFDTMIGLLRSGNSDTTESGSRNLYRFGILNVLLLYLVSALPRSQSIAGLILTSPRCAQMSWTLHKLLSRLAGKPRTKYVRSFSYGLKFHICKSDCRRVSQPNDFPAETI